MKNIYVYEIPYRNRYGKKRKVLHMPDNIYKYIMYFESIMIFLVFAGVCTHIIPTYMYFIFIGMIWMILIPMLFWVETDTMKRKREDYLNKKKENVE